MVKGNDTLHFYYDSNNSPIAFTRNNTMYYYVKNIQGDIIKIVSEDGCLAYTYDYDAWGALISIQDNQGHVIPSTGNSLATTNPLRYRGYVYDDETGLYYLQSRYYDPKTGRFLNADVYFDTESGSPLSTNMFAYCENNTIFSFDFYGTKSRLVETRYARHIPQSVRVHVIYYSGDSGFSTQAHNFIQYKANSKNTSFKGVRTANDFVNAWNHMPKNIAYLFLFVHGGQNALYFCNSEISENPQRRSSIKRFFNLKQKSIKCQIWLLSCKGAAGGNKSAAEKIASRSIGAEVIALSSSLCFSKNRDGYYARPKFLSGGIWYYFQYYYNNRGKKCYRKGEYLV